jgi:uncharacterized protein YjbJ (UPF0337 family)
VPGGVAGQGYPAESESFAADTARRVSGAASGALYTARETADHVREAAHDAANRVSEVASAAASAASHAASDAAVQAQELAGQVREMAVDAATQAKGAAREFTGNVREMASDIAGQATHGASHAADYAGRAGEDWARSAETATTRARAVTGRAAERATSLLADAGRNPVVLGGIGVLVGTLVGRSFLQSERGEQLAGQTRRALDRGAREAAEAATSIARTATERASGLASTASEGLGSVAKSGSRQPAPLGRRARELASGVTRGGARVLRFSGDTPRGPRQAARRGSQRPRPPSRTQLDLGRQAQAVRTWFDDEVIGMRQRYPLLLAALGLTAGALVGGSLRLTEAERRSFRPIGSKLREQVQDVVGEQYAHVKGTVEQLASELPAALRGGETGGAGPDSSDEGQGATPRPSAADVDRAVSARAGAAGVARPDPLTEEEHRELERRLAQPVGPRLDAGRAPDPDQTPSSRAGFEFNDEDHVRAAFGLSGSPVGDGGSGRMRGGFGGDGYRNYGDAGPEARGAAPVRIDDAAFPRTT